MKNWQRSDEFLSIPYFMTTLVYVSNSVDDFQKQKWQQKLKHVNAQAAGERVDPAQKRTRPKHAFLGREPPRDQRLLKSIRRVRQKRVSVFEKKLLGYLVKILNRRR